MGHGYLTMTNTLTVTGFICAVRDRLISRAGFAPENAIDCALAAIEDWEKTAGVANLSRRNAQRVADDYLLRAV
jgi:hypothetical protein